VYRYGRTVAEVIGTGELELANRWKTGWPLRNRKSLAIATRMAYLDARNSEPTVRRYGGVEGAWRITQALGLSDRSRRSSVICPAIPDPFLAAAR